MIIDLREGFGVHKDYILSKFPDNSLKFKLLTFLHGEEDIFIKTSLRSNEDILILGLICDFFEGIEMKVTVQINYMMYQQDDRRFSNDESFGLKFIARFLNSFKNIEEILIFHPHSDKVELIDKCTIVDNTAFINWALGKHIHYPVPNGNSFNNPYWVIPDSGAFKTQFKQIEKIWEGRDFITCMKSRNHVTSEIETVVNCEDLESRDCFIVDDICLGGRTFINIAQELKKKNCGKLYLIVSHGIFNNGIGALLDHFECIYTTDSICLDPESNSLKKFIL